MTMMIFVDWLLKFERSMKMQNRDIILLVDNASGHNVTETLKKKLTNTTLKYFDPNVTSHIQPCDQGIIRNLKVHYRPMLLKNCLNVFEDKNELIIPKLKEAICMVREAWNKVSSKTIANCWRHAGIAIIFYLFLLITYYMEFFPS